MAKAERYVALWQQRGGLPTGPPLDSSDEVGKKAYIFLKERRQELPRGDPQVHAILSAAFPKWAITRKRKQFAETGESFEGVHFSRYHVMSSLLVPEDIAQLRYP
jgi:hypothetical protein